MDSYIDNVDAAPESLGATPLAGFTIRH
jgi:hypothetical protein